jgi:hypothetical protein
MWKVRALQKQNFFHAIQKLFMFVSEKLFWKKPGLEYCLGDIVVFMKRQFEWINAMHGLSWNLPVWPFVVSFEPSIPCWSLNWKRKERSAWTGKESPPWFYLSKWKRTIFCATYNQVWDLELLSAEQTLQSAKLEQCSKTTKPKRLTTTSALTFARLKTFVFWITSKLGIL